MITTTSCLKGLDLTSMWICLGSGVEKDMYVSNEIK